MNPTVDIILPNYNYSRFIDSCLQSIACQSGVQVRVLLLDDGSTQKYSYCSGRSFPCNIDVQIHEHRFNRGHIYTYNQGIRLIEAPYYMILSPDDQLLPGGLALLVSALNQYPQASFTFGPALMGSNPDSAKATLGILGLEPFAGEKPILIPGADFQKQLSSLWFNPIPTPSVLIRTQAQRQAGGYRFTHPSAGDLEMWLRLCAQGPVVYIPTPIAFYRQHRSSMQAGYLSKQWREPWHLMRVYLERHVRHGVHTIAHSLLSVALGSTKSHNLAALLSLISKQFHFFNGSTLENSIPHLDLASERYASLHGKLLKMSYQLRSILSAACVARWKIFILACLSKLCNMLPPQLLDIKQSSRGKKNTQ